MKKVKVKFFDQHEYNGMIFLQGHIYELVDTDDGFVSRWLRRGCQIVESDMFFNDPRFPVKEISEKLPAVEVSNNFKTQNKRMRNVKAK